MCSSLQSILTYLYNSTFIIIWQHALNYKLFTKNGPFYAFCTIKRRSSRMLHLPNTTQCQTSSSIYAFFLVHRRPWALLQVKKHPLDNSPSLPERPPSSSPSKQIKKAVSLLADCLFLQGWDNGSNAGYRLRCSFFIALLNCTPNRTAVKVTAMTSAMGSAR